MFEITEFKGILDLLKTFPDEQSCINHFEKCRWNGKVISPFDTSSKVYKCKGNKYKCKNTGKYFNFKTGTMFDDSKVPLLKWYMAIYLIASHKKGISSYQLAKDIDVTQKTAWFLLHRIRSSFDIEKFNGKMDGTIISDETFVGGKNKNRHKNKKYTQVQSRKYIDKTPVMGLLNKERGIVRTFVLPDTDLETLEPVLINNINEGSTLFTDEWPGYNNCNKWFNHHIVNHTGKQYVNGEVTTNSIENFWSHLKRGIIGIYHQVSKQHLHLYASEFAYRYNTRNISESQRFHLCLQSTDKPLRYKTLVLDGKKAKARKEAQLKNSKLG